MKFASIGDFCIDQYPDKKLLGGTAYNSAITAKNYGVDVSVISAIGNDEDGQKYIESLRDRKINTEHLSIVSKQTSRAAITLDREKSPIFGEWELGALEDWGFSQSDLAFIKGHDIAKVIFLKPLQQVFTKFYQTQMPNTLKAGDFAGNSQYSFSVREIEKYVDGLDIIIKSLDANDKEEIMFLKELARTRNKIILVMLGKNGSICFTNKQSYTQNAEKITTTNTTGFGDAFIAVFLVEYFKNKNIQVSLSAATNAIKKLSDTIIS